MPCMCVLVICLAKKHYDDRGFTDLCDRVKFRDDEDLQVLTASRQSGGERSVSTILYLISIQVRRHCHAWAFLRISAGLAESC